MTGSVYKRVGSPFWWAAFVLHGRRYSKSTGVPAPRGTIGKAEAKKRLAHLTGEARRGITPDADKIALPDLERLVVADLEMNGKVSVDRAKVAYRRLREHFAATPALQIPPVADEYVTARKKAGAKNSTIRQELAWLGRGFRLAARKGLVPIRPELPTVSVSNARQGFATAEQLEALVSHLPDYMQAPTRWAFSTGWRKGEVFGLRWAQVDIANGSARLEATDTKNRTARAFPYHVMPELKALIASQRATTTAWERVHAKICPWVFHRDGANIADFRTVWLRATKAAKLEGLTFHDLRRSAIRQMELAGVPRSTAMRLSGHKTESTYTRYAITAQADLEAGVAKIAELHHKTAANGK
jgi:integrase